jgi:prepilin-type N-terminal cleavage/methylation domain-containing protein
MRHLPHPIQSVRAFTLIEMMLAIGIMAMVIAVMNGVFFTALRLRDHTAAAVDDALPAQQATAIIRRDLQCAMAPGGVLAGDFKVGGVSEPNMSQPVDIEMYTPTGALRESEPWADIQMVTYELKSPTTSSATGGKDLIRSVTRNLLSTTTPDVADQWLMSGVQDLHFSCYDGTQWQDSWDTTSSNTNLPLAVRVRIQLAGAGTTGPIEMVIPVVSQVRTNQVQPIAN